MLSRRNVRIKVMQLLYNANRDSALKYHQVERAYKQRVQNSYKTYLFNLYLLYKVANYAKQDVDTRKSKHLPSDIDKAFSDILVTNPLMDSLATNVGFFQNLKDFKLTTKVNSDIIRQVYFAFAESQEYVEYATKGQHEEHEHLAMLLALYKFCIKNELFLDNLEEAFPNWIDDDSLVTGAMKKTIKAMPLHEFFYKEYIPDDETVEEYGTELLYKVSHLDQDLLEIIEPYLQNWEADRVAILDMILLKMALCEFLHFPTIPTKVTINEYIDISKMYSTPKSKDFINGILDRLLKKLHKEGKITKQGRGLVG